ncbi:MAG: ABC transporter ATP-binding protein [Planctomycetes bacterium]|nr:ABC transporter ATP-binding protein [Planctomycetota bacterium]
MSGLPISVEKLSYSYPDGRLALDGVTFRVAAGERVALVGANGAGKSTLILHLNGILTGQGDVQVGELMVRKNALKEIRQRVGLLFQDPDDQLFCPTVGEDVAFGPRNLGLKEPEVQERVHDCLTRVGLHGFDGRFVYHLSVGEKKRAALAGVLAMNPGVLALDEPSASLDPRGRRELLALLKGIDSTMLVVTHDLEFARELCPRSIVMSGGKVVADKPTAELLGDAALLTEHGLA